MTKDREAFLNEMDEMVVKRHRFKVEICDTHCGMCGPNVKPDFCQFLYDSDPKLFLHKVIGSIIMIGRTMPQFKKLLVSYEGFRALFCSARKLCKFKSFDCKSYTDCYQIFIYQSGLSIKDTEKQLKNSEWSKGRYQECINTLDKIETLIRSGMKPAKRKKLFKILKRLGNIYRDLTDHPKKRKNKTNYIKPTAQSKKKITTLFFSRWPEKIDPIFKEGEKAACVSKSAAG